MESIAEVLKVRYPLCKILQITDTAGPGGPFNLIYLPKISSRAIYDNIIARRYSQTDVLCDTSNEAIVAENNKLLVRYNLLEGLRILTEMPRALQSEVCKSPTEYDLFIKNQPLLEILQLLLTSVRDGSNQELLYIEPSLAEFAVINKDGLTGLFRSLLAYSALSKLSIGVVELGSTVSSSSASKLKEIIHSGIKDLYLYDIYSKADPIMKNVGVTREEILSAVSLAADLSTYSKVLWQKLRMVHVANEKQIKLEEIAKLKTDLNALLFAHFHNNLYN